MDNSAFRSMVSSASPRDVGTTATPSTFKKPTALGSRARSSISMTPRNISGYNPSREFARQVKEHTSSSADTAEPPLKKFKSSAAPKGTKIGAGYVDRAQLRKAEKTNEITDKAERLKNLEEQLKLGQIDQAQFESLRSQIGVGGDVSSTHLVKGLDWKLLERVRKGEDVSQPTQQDDDSERQGESVAEMDVDEALEQALEKEVVARQRDKGGQTHEQNEAPRQILTRDQILQRLKAQRNAPAPSPPLAAPVLNDRFKKVAATEKPVRKKFTESVNGRRREVLIITNKDGTTKRKTRWIDPDDATRTEQQPLGMEVPKEMAAKQRAMLEADAAADDDGNIFADVGDDYDLLADINSDDELSETEQKQGDETQLRKEVLVTKQKRNYFSSTKDEDEASAQQDMAAARDSTILVALKRAADIRKREEEVEHESGNTSTNQMDMGPEAKSSAFLAKLQERERQDAADLDYGFGESRFGDEDEDDEGAIWDDGHDGEKKSGSRKRGPKKRKGNKDNVQDVMNAIEGRNKKS